MCNAFGQLMSHGNGTFMSVCMCLYSMEFNCNFTYVTGCNGQEQCLS